MVSVIGPEARTFTGIEFRAEKGSQFFEVMAGRAVPYSEESNIGWFVEVHEPGSFAKTIRENPRLPLLLFHDSRKFPIGRVDQWHDRDEGLDAVWKLDSADEAQEAARLASEQMLTGLSIGFVPVRTMWEDRDGVEIAHRQESRLLEVSLTPTPAFGGALVDMVRSRSAEERVAQRVAREWRPSAAVREWRRTLEGLQREPARP